MNPRIMNAAYIRRLVAGLSDWRENEDNDPNWVYEAEVFGWRHPIMDLPELDQFNKLAEIIDIDSAELCVINPCWVLYTPQRFIRLDAIYHYLDSDDLFDQDGWFGNDYPVISEWKDGYVVFDGNHRITADKIMGRLSKVLYCSQKNLRS